MAPTNPSSFIQEAPSFPKNLESDVHLKQCIEQYVRDKSQREVIYCDLKRFYEEVIPQAHNWALEAEQNPPSHIPYSAFGQRIDEIQVSPGWKNLDALSAKEELIKLGYKNGGNRIHQFLKLYLFHPSSAFYTCPLAMTDGAAKLITMMKGQSEDHVEDELQSAFDNLTSNDPDKFWTSGQWMTEKTGGSDVGISQTIAYKDEENYKLYGTKWFTSATTSQMCFTLARIKDEQSGEIQKGLSLFFIKLRDDLNKLQGIEVRRLKDKLGTKALPTAEIDFTGAKALLVGEEQRGIPNISHLFNVTRIYNACTSVGAFRRLLYLANDYAHKRIAFGKKLIDQPLHQGILSEAQVAFDKCFRLTFFTVSLLEKVEQDHTLEAEAKLLRLLTPLIKLYTAKKNMNWTSELVESFGGAGFIEDTGIPRFLRDAQVLCIWEGTTNVLALDCLRAIQKEKAFKAYLEVMNKLIKEKNEQEPSLKALEELQLYVEARNKEPSTWEPKAREFAFLLAETTAEII